MQNNTPKTVQTQKYIVKFFPEIMVKGSSAKRQMVGQLYNNLVKLLHAIDETIYIKKFSDKIEVVTPLKVVDAVRSRLLNTPGIELVLEALQYDNFTTIDQIKEKVLEVIGDELEGKTFVVRVKRVGTHEFKSSEIERTVGGYVLAHSKAKSVDLHNPEITVRLEYINQQLNIITKRYDGLSGFPIGTQGEALSLMSGGFDSTVASYLSIKRGIKTHFIFFNLGGDAHEIGVKQVSFYLWNKFGASHRVKIISVPFDEVLTEIFRSTSNTYMGVTLKRLMLMAAEKIAIQMNIDALITGESVAQVSSQTLRNLALIDQSTNMLVLRPLAMVNKPEIIDIATKIGTRYFAENMPEYCGVISKNPVTHGSYKRMEKEANAFNYDILYQAVENAKTIYADTVIENVTQNAPVEIISELNDEKYIIIDIRGNSETISLSSCESLNIPFYKLRTEFKKLPQDRKYLLYCDKGVMSQLHAQYLRDSESCKNVKVYRP